MRRQIEVGVCPQQRPVERVAGHGGEGAGRGGTRTRTRARARARARRGRGGLEIVEHVVGGHAAGQAEPPVPPKLALPVTLTMKTSEAVPLRVSEALLRLILPLMSMTFRPPLPVMVVAAVDLREGLRGREPRGRWSRR